MLVLNGVASRSRQKQLIGMAPPTRSAIRNNSSSDNNSNTANLSIDQKLDLLLNDVAEIKNTNTEFKEDINAIKEEFKQFKIDINESIEMCYGKIKDCEESTKKNRGDIEKHGEELESIVSENIQLKKEVIKLQAVVSAAEQYSRSNCLEVRGVPEMKNEVIMDVVKNIARSINFNLNKSMIDAVHRLASNPSVPHAPRGIIIKFCRRLDLEDMRKKTRVKNGFSAAELGYQSENQIFISLSMTRETSALWKHTRDFKKQHGYKYAWVTSTGKIFVRKDEGMKAVHITTKHDLERLK